MKIDVWVAGRRWRQVDSFAGAGTEDEVFVLDREKAILQFGDGVKGKRPPKDAEVIVAMYRHGAGGRGDVGREGPPIQTTRAGDDDATDAALWTVIRAHEKSIQIPTPRRKPHPAG